MFYLRQWPPLGLAHTRSASTPLSPSARQPSAKTGRARTPSCSRNRESQSERAAWLSLPALGCLALPLAGSASRCARGYPLRRSATLHRWGVARERILRRQHSADTALLLFPPRRKFPARLRPTTRTDRCPSSSSKPRTASGTCHRWVCLASLFRCAHAHEFSCPPRSAPVV